MYYISKCMHGPTAVYAIGDIIYYGSGAARASDFRGDLVINFTPYPNLPVSITNITELKPYLDLPFKEIMLPWPDMGTPYVKPEFWKELHNYVEKNKFEHVCFHCQAGHGRTGTALSAMLIVNGGWAATDALRFVRENYCVEVVESHSQTAYLKELDRIFNDNEGSDDVYDMVPSSMLKADISEDGAPEKVILTEESEENKIIFD